jgi:hypothetical protein
VALIAASMLGVAAAEAPTSTPTRTVAVQGVANVPIAQGSSAAAATAVYRQAMAAAVTDAQSKAEFLAGKVGASAGPAQTVAEDGGSISCVGPGESSYVPYEGEEPDFGSPSARVVPLLAGRSAAPSGAPAPVRVPLKKHRKSKPRPKGRAATVAPGCTLSAEVSISYALG